MAPYVTLTFGQHLATGNPANVPATHAISAKPAMTGMSGQTMAVVTTDAGPVSVSLSTNDNIHWFVYDIEPGAQPEN